MKKLTLICFLSAVLVAASCSTGEHKRSDAPRGRLDIGMPDPGTLDPARAFGPYSHLLLETACNTIFSLDAEEGDPRGALAESWRLSADGKLLDIAIAPGAKFQAGQPVDAHAIRESLSRVVRPATSSIWSGLLRDIEGYDDVISGSAEFLAGVRVTGPLRLQVSLIRPNDQVIQTLAHPGLTPVAGEAFDPPNCAGPYRIARAEGQVRLARVATGSTSKAYEREGRGLANLLSFSILPDEAAAYALWKEKKLDIAPVPVSLAFEAQTARDSYVRQTLPEITYLAFNPSQEPGPPVRRAISLALDRLSIIDATLGDGRQASLSWTSNGTDADSPCAAYVRKISDPAKAKAELQLAGVDPGRVKVSLWFDTSAIGHLVAQAMEVQVMDAAGIDIEPKGVDTAAFLESLRNKAPGSAWIGKAAFPAPASPINFTDLFRSASPLNSAGLSDPSLDTLIDAAHSEGPSGTEVEQIEAAVCDSMVYVPLWRGVAHWVFAHTVEFAATAKLDLHGHPVLRNARLSR